LLIVSPQGQVPYRQMVAFTTIHLSFKVDRNSSFMVEKGEKFIASG